MNEAPLNPRNAPGGKGPGSPCGRAELAGEGPRHQEQGPEGVRVVRLGKKTGLAASHRARETLVNHRGGPPSGLASLVVLSSNSSKNPFAQTSDPRKNKTRRPHLTVSSATMASGHCSAHRYKVSGPENTKCFQKKPMGPAGPQTAAAATTDAPTMRQTALASKTTGGGLPEHSNDHRLSGFLRRTSGCS